MLSTGRVSEGVVPFRGYQTWYRVVGDLTSPPAGVYPLLTLHGSPISHEALEPLERLSEAGRPVIFYDQLGCGRSDQPDDPTIWSRTLFVDEVEAVRRALGLERVHLFGHSWGGTLALEYALQRPERLLSLTVASASACDADFEAAVHRLHATLPPAARAALRRHEEAGTTDDPEYQAAQRIFDLRHICRIDPWPDFLQRACRRLTVSVLPPGAWDVRARLSEIALPTLVTCGRHDMASPNLAMDLHTGIRDSELVIFDESSHYPHAEEPERYLAVLQDFLTRVEQRGTAHSWPH